MIATCNAGRQIDTGSAPTFIHADDNTECDHGRAILPTSTVTGPRLGDWTITNPQVDDEVPLPNGTTGRVTYIGDDVAAVMCVSTERGPCFGPLHYIQITRPTQEPPMTTFELTVGEYDDTKSLGEYPTRDDAHRALGVYAMAHGDQALHPQITEQPSAPVWTVTREGDGWHVRAVQWTTRPRPGSLRRPAVNIIRRLARRPADIATDLVGLIDALIIWLRRMAESCRRSHDAGCCGCGAKVVRYVYAGPWRGRIVPDDARCETCGPIVGHPVAVDYSRDVEITVGEMGDAVTAATTDHSVARLTTTAGLTVGQLRHLIHHLPADTPVRVEDPSRPGPTPGSTAEHTVTGAATGMPLHDGADGVLLLIDPAE